MAFTQSVEDFFWDYPNYYEQVRAKTARTVENLTNVLSLQNARTQLEQMYRQYACSARRFLMRAMERTFAGAEEQGCTVPFHGKEYVFPPATEEHITSLSTEECNRYVNLLSEICAENSGDSPAEWKTLLRKAMQWHYKIPVFLSLPEGYRLAHALRFDFPTAQEFLVRSLNDDGFAPNRSEDLIEAFCFLYPACNDVHTAQRLREEYARRSEGIPKVGWEEKEENFTAALSDSLERALAEWLADADLSVDEVEEQFLCWLLERSNRLDLPGRSAGILYRNLAVCCWELVSGKDRTLAFDSLEEGLQERCFTEELTLPEGMDGYQFSHRLLSLLFDTTSKTVLAESAQQLRTISVGEDSRLSARSAAERIPLLLSGEERVSKSDLLFLLWFVCTKCWEIAELEGEETDFGDKLFDFWSAAEAFLRRGNLPRFYPPHPLEYSFLLSLCCEGNDAPGSDPVELYQAVCDAIAPRQSRKPRSNTEAAGRYQGSMSLDVKAERKAIKAAYQKGDWQDEGIAAPLLAHLLAHGKQGCAYLFTANGIACLPNPAVILTYPRPETAKRFDPAREDYTSPEAQRARHRLLYTLSLALGDGAAGQGVTAEFRTNFKRTCSLTLQVFR